MPKTIFDFLGDLTQHKTKWDSINESDRKGYSNFMINRWISMKMEYLPVVAETQKLTMAVAPEFSYRFYLDFLPKEKMYVKYVSSKTEKIPEMQSLISFLCKKFNMSEREIEENLDLLLEDETIITDYLKRFGYNDKDVQKIFKISKGEKGSNTKKE